jgi:small neutral amino acid transporter SnatA (MarC family)
VLVFINFHNVSRNSMLRLIFPDEGLRVVTALMSILILAIAIQFIINGATEAMSQIFGK